MSGGYTHITVLLLAACAIPLASAINADERGLLSVKMVNLSSAVDTYFRLLPRDPEGFDDTNLRMSTRHDPSLLEQFANYVLKTQYQDPYAVVLLCTQDGKQAIMEDAGCSARLDRQVTGDAPCEFTLRVAPECIVEGADQQ
jgi:hypothetical protein